MLLQNNEKTLLSWNIEMVLEFQQFKVDLNLHVFWEELRTDALFAFEGEGFSVDIDSPPGWGADDQEEAGLGLFGPLGLEVSAPAWYSSLQVRGEG